MAETLKDGDAEKYGPWIGQQAEEQPLAVGTSAEQVEAEKMQKNFTALTKEEQAAEVARLNREYDFAKAAEQGFTTGEELLAASRQEERGGEAWLAWANDQERQKSAPAEKKPSRFWLRTKGFLGIMASIIGITLLEAARQSWGALHGTWHDVLNRLTGGAGLGGADGSHKKSKVT